MLSAARIFGEGMVLQRGKRIPVWGEGAPGKEITVTLQGQETKTTVRPDGSWMVYLEPLMTSEKERMVIRCQDESLIFDHVAAGEVWLLGGQSNMEFHMRYDRDMAEEKSRCEDGLIRFFDYPEVSYPEQVEEADYWKEYGFWRPCKPDQLERFSAVGYYFAKELRRYLDVPVGLIGCNWGGTPACTWMDETHIRKGGGEVFLREYQKALDKLDKEAYEAAFRANPASYHTDLLADPISDLMLFGATMEELGAKLMEMGIDPQAVANYQPVIGPKYERRPCGLYESMLKPLSPYGLRGFLYYQGETDGDNHPECYKTLFPQLIENWRDLWKEGLPFYFVQIAPLEQWMQCVGKPYAMIREAQQHTADTVPLTGMASTSDVGMQWDIHPKKKRPVGERLAYLALHQVYGLDLVCEAPRLIGAERKKDKLILHFPGAEPGV